MLVVKSSKPAVSKEVESAVNKEAKKRVRADSVGSKLNSAAPIVEKELRVHSH